MADGMSLDPVWEEKYANGHEQRYPWDLVVSFVLRNAPRDRARSSVRILEVGCGTGANIRFAAAEGFTVSGVDGSTHAIARAKKRFEQEGLEGDLRVGDFTALPFEDSCFDLVIDRAALTCCGAGALSIALGEIWRVLKPEGRFLFNPYSDTHTGYRTGQAGPDNVIERIPDGDLAGVGQIHFVSRSEVDMLFRHGWRLLSVKRMELTEMLGRESPLHGEWRVIAAKGDTR
jgi:SAM-dependent methyltransferase